MEFFPNNNYELLENIPMANQYSMLTCNNFVELPMQTNLQQNTFLQFIITALNHEYFSQ